MLNNLYEIGMVAIDTNLKVGQLYIDMVHWRAAFDTKEDLYNRVSQYPHHSLIANTWDNIIWENDVTSLRYWVFRPETPMMIIEIKHEHQMTMIKVLVEEKIAWMLYKENDGIIPYAK